MIWSSMWLLIVRIAATVLTARRSWNWLSIDLYSEIVVERVTVWLLWLQ